MRSFLLCLAFSVLAFSALATETESLSCGSDKSFGQRGWIVSSADFDRKAEAAMKAFEVERAHFVDDLQGVVFSTVANRMVRVQSWDDLRSPQHEMYGDLVVVHDAMTGELMEIRAYRGGRKLLFYSPVQTPCATAMIPMAENALL